MFLSTRSGSIYEEHCGSQMGTVAAGGNEPWVESCGEMQRTGLISPGGLRWYPAAGQGVLVVKAGSFGEESCILGVEHEKDESLAPGEVQLFSKGASLTLKNDGRILLEGSVFLNGEELSGAS